MRTSLATRWFALLSVCIAMALHAATPLRLAIVSRSDLPADVPPATVSQALAAAEEQGGFISLSSTDKPARRPTSFRMAWSDSILCLTVTCPLTDGPPFVASVMDHDGTVWTDDCLELFLQPAGMDGYYHFGWNPAGTQSEERVQDLSWEAPWRVRCDVTKDAWTSVVTIPFTAIGGAPAPDSLWRFNLCRSDQANHEYSSWSFSGGGFHRPDRFGWLLFSGAAAGAPLSAGVVTRLRDLFFPGAVIAGQRAEIVDFLQQRAVPATGTETPVYAQLRDRLTQTDRDLRTTEELFAALARANLAAALAGAGAVPEWSRRADDAMNRWRIEELLTAAEQRRTAGEKP